MSGKPRGSGLRKVLNAEMVRTYAAKGMNLNEIGLMYGYSKERVGNVISENPELKEAWDQGNAIMCDTLTSALMRLVDKDNLVAIIFALKSRCGWVEQQYLINKPDINLSPQVSVYLPENYRSQAITLEQTPELKLTAN